MWRWRIPSWQKDWTCKPTGASCLSGCPSRHALPKHRLPNHGWVCAHPAGKDMTAAVCSACCHHHYGVVNPLALIAGDREAAYAFVFPNLMINRYGPWMDTNVVMPAGPERCTVQFDYFLDQGLSRDSDGIASNLCSSDQVCSFCFATVSQWRGASYQYCGPPLTLFALALQVQQEDIRLCESVQRGLHSPAYDSGRYAPGLEFPMHHFHSMLHAALCNGNG